MRNVWRLRFFIDLMWSIITFIIRILFHGAKFHVVLKLQNVSDAGRSEASFEFVNHFEKELTLL